MTLIGAADSNIWGESREEVIHPLSFVVFSFYSLISAPLLWNVVELWSYFLNFLWMLLHKEMFKADHPVQTDKYAESDKKRLRSRSNFSLLMFKSELTQAV